MYNGIKFEWDNINSAICGGIMIEYTILEIERNAILEIALLK